MAYPRTVKDDIDALLRMAQRERIPRKQVLAALLDLIDAERAMRIGDLYQLEREQD